jgi:large subunit ribosomal protein L22
LANLPQQELSKDTQEIDNMEAVAKLNNCPLSPRKMRLVVDQIRGENVNKALSILKFNQKQAYALLVEKLLLSAIANWQLKNDAKLDEETGLVVKSIFVNQGRTIKRLSPAPQGRAYRVRKRSNHITLVVDVVGETVETVN